MNTALTIEQKFILAKQGDKAAFEQLYNELITPVYRFILVRTKNRELAEDLTQQVFLKALEALPKSQAPTLSPLAYFLTAARRIVIDHWRKKKDILVAMPEETFEQLPSTSLPADQLLVAADDIAEVYAAMEELNDDQREVLILKFINEQSNETIARMMDKSEEAIRQIQSRALKQLRHRLAPTT